MRIRPVVAIDSGDRVPAGSSAIKYNVDEVAETRANHAALVTMCDQYFGRLLDDFDRHDLWRDTAIVMSTDHGRLLSEHDWWGKNRMPFFETISHVPLVQRWCNASATACGNGRPQHRSGEPGAHVGPAAHIVFTPRNAFVTRCCHSLGRDQPQP